MPARFMLRSTARILARLAPARVLLLFLLHAVIFAACYVFATLVRFEFTLGPRFYIRLFRASLPLVVTVQLVVGFFFDFYRGWWRYVGIADLIRVVVGLTVSLLLLLGLWYVGPSVALTERVTGVSRGVLLIDWAFAILALLAARVLVRVGAEMARNADESASATKKVLIIGAGDAGETLLREIQHRPQLNLRVVGFVDDHQPKWNSRIRGIEVRGPISKIRTIADNSGATEALLAIPSASGKRIREIVHILGEAGLAFRTIPGIDHLVSGKVHVTQLRPVNVEDLLRREKIELPGDPVRELFRARRVLITGAGGTIGSELARQIVELEPESLVLVERSEFALYETERRLRTPSTSSRLSAVLADFSDRDAMLSLVRARKPEIVLHAAAHKHVPLGEANAAEYLRNNCVDAHRFADLCAAEGVSRFVLISTDKAIHPTSVMGASKRAAEIAILRLAEAVAMGVTIVRFGNVIGSSGSVIPLFLEQIAAGGPVTVTHADVTRYFLRTSEAVSLVLQAASLGETSRVYMLDMGEPVRIADLARDLIQLANQTERDIPVVFTGLRPGEKLFEEIRLTGETVRPTLHPQIVITEAPQPPPAVVDKWLAEVSSKRLADDEATRRLQQLVPEFQRDRDRQAYATA